MMKLLEDMPTPLAGSTTLLKPPPRRRRWLLAVTGLPLLLAAGVGITRLRSDHAPSPAPASASAEAPAAVNTVRPVRQTIRKTIDQPGRVEGYEQAPIHVKIPGFV